MLTLNSKGANWGSKYKLYLFAHEKHTHAVFLKYIRSFLIDLLRLHDTSGCQTGWTTGWMFVYTMQPVVQPVWQPAVLCTRGFNDHARKDFAAMSFLCCGKCVQPVILWVARHRYCQYLLSVNSLDKSIFFDYNFDQLNPAWPFESGMAACFIQFLRRRISWTQIFHKVG